MTTFRYEAYAKSGALQKGEVSAASKKDALAQLSSKGLLAVKIGKKQDALFFGNAVGAKTSSRLKTHERARLIRSIATITEAQIPIDEAMALVAGSTEKEKIKNLCLQVRDKLAEGIPFFRAIDIPAFNFERFELGWLEAGEKSGAFQEALSGLAKYLEDRAEFQRKISSALVYPSFLVFMAVVCLVIIALVLVPNLLPLFQGTGVDPPFLLNAISKLVSFASTNLIMLATGLLTFALALMIWSRTFNLKGFADQLTMKTPGISKWMLEADTSRVARLLGDTLANGSQLTEALVHASKACKNTEIERRIGNVAKQISQGSSLTNALNEEAAVTQTARSMISVGERSGRLPSILIHISNVHKQLIQQRAERLVTLLTPTVTIIIGLLVGAMILSVMSAIISVNDLAL